MSRVYSDTVLPEDSGVNQDFTFGTTGDTVQVTSGATLKVNTLKDAGGNTIFTSDGSGNLSSMNSGLSGGPALITTNTVSGGASSTFTTGIDSTYRVYIFSFNSINPATDTADWEVNFSSDGGSNYNMIKTTTKFMAWQGETGGGGQLLDRPAQDLMGSTDYQNISESVGSGADECTAGEVWMFNPSSTTLVTHFWAHAANFYSGNEIYNAFVSGWIGSSTVSSAIIAVAFKMSTGNFDGEIKMYGL